MTKRIFPFIIILLMLSLLFSCGEEKPQEPTLPDDSTSANTGSGTSTPGTEAPGENADGENGKDGQINTDASQQKLVFARNGQTSSTYIVSEYDTDIYNSVALTLRDKISDALNTNVTVHPSLLYPYDKNSDCMEIIIGNTDRTHANAALWEYLSSVTVDKEYFCFVQISNDLIFYASSLNAYEYGLSRFEELFINGGMLSATIGYKYFEALAF